VPFKNGLEQNGFVDHDKRFDKVGKELESKIISKQGYNIQSDVISEQTTHVDFIPNSSTKKSSLYDKAAVVAATQNTAKKMETVAHPDDKYIYFDKTDQKTGEFVNDVFRDGHDKMAMKSTTTTEAGGAKIESYFSCKGKLTSEITLNQGKNRTDRKGFNNKIPAFLDKVDDLFIATKFDENEAAASYVDEYASKKLDKQKRKFVKEAARFSDIKSEATREIKSIKRDIKEEKIREREQEKSPLSENVQMFKDSSAKFTDPNEKFFDKYAYPFRNELQDPTGNSIFILPVIEHTIENNQLNKEKSIKNGNDNQKNELINDVNNRGKKVVEQVDTKQDVSKPNSTVQSSENNKSIDSYFTNADSNSQEASKAIPNRFMTKEERLEQEKAKKKTADQEKNKQLRRAAAATALSNLLRVKKEAQNDLADMSGSRVTGNLLNDGKGPILATIGSALSQGIQNFAKSLMKKIATKIISLIGAALGGCVLPLIIILACSLLLLVGYADSGEVYDLSLGGDGITHQSLTSEEIDGIITSLYVSYNNPVLGTYNMSSTQEAILRYALSKVGCSYDQGKHWSLTEDIFDCSSLAMRAYREVGIDIKNRDAFSASEECRVLENLNEVVGNDLIPGDLIFYGGRANGRYRGIYHVAIYVGNGKMVEARSKSMGVVYGDVRSTNVVICARPFR